MTAERLARALVALALPDWPVGARGLIVDDHIPAPSGYAEAIVLVVGVRAGETYGDAVADAGDSFRSNRPGLRGEP